MSEGAERIAKERRRQIDEEGWTAEHDDQHQIGDLAAAAVCYAWAACISSFVRKSAAQKPNLWWGYSVMQNIWPWHIDHWKPSPGTNIEGRMRDLEKAGALCAAEIDRLLRLQTKQALREADTPERGKSV